MTVKILPENATEQAVKWSSSDENIVKVNDSGAIKGMSKGSAVITVSTISGDHKARIPVTVEYPYATIQTAEKIQTDSIQAIKGNAYQRYYQFTANQSEKYALKVKSKTGKGYLSQFSLYNENQQLINNYFMNKSDSYTLSLEKGKPYYISFQENEVKKIAEFNIQGFTRLKPALNNKFLVGKPEIFIVTDEYGRVVPNEELIFTDVNKDITKTDVTGKVTGLKTGQAVVKVKHKEYDWIGEIHCSLSVTSP